MRVLVTGGAGFIGSAVCRHFISDLEHDVVVVDKLTYAGNMASLAPVASSPHYRVRKARHLRCRGGQSDLRQISAGRGGSSRRREPRRSFDIRLRRVRENKCRLAPSRCSRRPVDYLHRAGPIARLTFASFMSRPTRSTVRLGMMGCSPRPRHTIRVRLIRQQRPLRTIWQRPGTGPRVAGDRVELFQQLRALSFSRKADSADHSQCAGSQAVARLW